MVWEERPRRACIPSDDTKVAETLSGKPAGVGHQSQGKDDSVVTGYREDHLSQRTNSQTSEALLCPTLSQRVGPPGEQTRPWCPHGKPAEPPA